MYEQNNPYTGYNPKPEPQTEQPPVQQPISPEPVPQPAFESAPQPVQQPVQQQPVQQQPVQQQPVQTAYTPAPSQSETTYHYSANSVPSQTPYFTPGSSYRPPEPPTPPARPAANPGPVPPQPKKKKKGWTAGKVVALILCCALLGGLFGFGGSLLANRLTDKDSAESSKTTTVYKSDRETAEVNVRKVDGESVMTAAELYAANVNSTVGITTSITTNFWGYQTTSAASGSGFIISEDGYILTNYHVIEDSDSITVTGYDNTAYDAELIGYDESNDIAVLKIDAEGLSPVVMGNSDDLNVGDSVIAIGNPLGELTFSLTAGVISALDREVTLSSGVTMDLLQTDCAINSGNSGGALFNMYGEVVGITNAKYSGSSSEASVDNIGFAIPINTVYEIVTSIIENGYIAKPYIGITVSSVSSENQGYGLPAGAAVQAVSEGSPSEKAGLQKNDIITECNGTVISTSGELVDIVAECEVDDVLNLKVYRQGEYLEITVTVGEQISSALAEEEADAESSASSSGEMGGNQYGGQYGQSVDPWSYFFGNMFGY